MNILDIAIAKKLAGGGGGSGTDNYNDLSNLPKINDTTLSGNKSSSALGLQSEINSDSKLASDLVDDTNQDNKFVTSTEKNTWNAKQNAIDADHKLSSDLVDDANKTNKFVTSTEKQTWNNKQNAIDSDHKLSSDLVDDANKTNKFVTSTEKNTWNAKQNAIDSDHKLSSSLVSFSTSEAAALASGIDSSKVGQISTNQTNILSVANYFGKNFHNPTIDSTYHVTMSESNGAITTESTGNWAFINYIEQVYPKGNYKAVVNITSLTQAAATMKILVRTRQTGSSWVDVSADITATGKLELNFVSDGTTALYIQVYMNQSDASNANSMTFTLPMVCLSDAYEADSSIVPYGAPNYDLTQLQSEDRAALVECVDKGAKNLLDSDDYIRLSNKMSYSNGTCTVEQQESDTLSNLRFRLKGYETTSSTSPVYNTNTMTVSENGKFFFTFTKSNTWSMARIMHSVKSSDTAADVYIAYDFSDLPNGDYVFACNVTNCVKSVGAYTWNSMVICTKAEWEISQKLTGYALPNTDLTREVSELQKKLEWSIENANFGCTAANTYEYTGLSVTVPATCMYEITAHDIFSTGAPLAIALCLSNTDINGYGVIVKENATPTSTNQPPWDCSLSFITPIRDLPITYYLWIKRSSLGDNNISFMYRQIV